MKIEQFKDGPLAHYSYAVISEGKMALIDPSRDPLPYYRFAEEHQARIVAVFETHPHADFVSGHLQIHQQTGATIYLSERVGADHEHQGFDDGDSFTMGEVTFHARNTPGHSPDSITIVAESGATTALFTGDTLFIGNVGRPDLRESAGNMTAQRTELARAMFRTIRDGFTDLPDEAIVFPAHGAGSLCGKNMSTDASSTLGQERRFNWAFQEKDEERFIANLLRDQPFIPHYFGFNVDLNKQGAENVQKTKASVELRISNGQVETGITIVDIRDAESFRKEHLAGSINIMGRGEKDKFETWLGAIVRPEEPFYLVLDRITRAEELLERVAKIGYEGQVKAVLTLPGAHTAHTAALDLERFTTHPDEYTIVDIRNEGEVAEKKIFEGSLSIPLHELRERVAEVPQDKPVVVHCAGGYRSSAGSSILEKALDVAVFDLGEDIRKF